MEKVYTPQGVEEKLYQKWQALDCFAGIRDAEKGPFTIVIPPPNITGQLHMGHALDNAMQDALIRYHRMRGDGTLWVPGSDHASIATEVKIVQQMATEGLTKDDVGREGFLERAWEWKAVYGGRIVNQLKKLGCSCDWERERFTMDEGCSRAVRKAFIDLYERGLIYRGDRIINWCPNCCTALSDAEVEYEDEDSFLWSVRYPAADGGEGVVVATTRPETMLGDTAVAVHPEDARYAHLIGKTVLLPLMDREIPVVADEYVDREFGTGAVKITPAHDPNDFEVAMRHDLPIMRIMDDNGVINDLGGKYEGQDRYLARKNIEADLTALGLLTEKKAYNHSVGHCYRCKTTIEPIISKQWFVRMKPLAAPAIEAVQSGRIQFVPKRFERVYFNWMENIRDWCISRQLWWGHRIPAWYCEDCGEVTVAAKTPSACCKCGNANLRQDEDVLDTWFSSGLWPFSTLGWPEQTEDLQYFYPTSVLVTGYDIIFFWVARMIVFGLAEMGEAPFHTVLIHGIVRDDQGRKMSKSLGNGIDPLEVIQQYGADALRFSLLNGTSPGNDMRFYMSKVEASRNFANKLWNAARFALMNIPERVELDAALLDDADKWILTRFHQVVADMDEAFARYDLGIASQKIYDFIWNEYCDWYIEMAKPHLYGEDAARKRCVQGVLLYVLEGLLKLIHPFMPYISEEIYGNLPGNDGMLILAPWPQTKSALTFATEAANMERAMDVVRAVRNLRAEMNVPPATRAQLILQGEHAQVLAGMAVYFEKLAGISDVAVLPTGAPAPENTVTAVCESVQAFLPIGQLVDIEKETARLNKELANLRNEIQRAQGKLKNESFVAKAPEKVVQAERDKIAKYEGMVEKVRDQLAQLVK